MSHHVRALHYAMKIEFTPVFALRLLAPALAQKGASAPKGSDLLNPLEVMVHTGIWKIRASFEIAQYSTLIHFRIHWLWI
jgi:hypothetical protein